MSFSIPATELAPAIVAVGLIVLGASSLLQAPRWLMVLRGLFRQSRAWLAPT